MKIKLAKLRKAISEVILEHYDLGVLPAVSIDIADGAVDPVLDTIKDVFLDDGYPYDHEKKPKKKGSEYGRMTRGKLFRMSKMSQSLHDRLEDGQEIPEWVKDKVSTAEDRLSAAYDYIDYKLHRMEQSGCVCHEGHARKFAREFLLSGKK